MPRYRISFAREWTLGRWGFLDRFFHDLGGRESEPSKLANAWIVDYRGNARRLGRELAAALNIQEVDYQNFGPIFDIEELASAAPRPKPPPEDGQPAAEVPNSGKTPEAAGTPPSEPAASAFFSVPTWVQSADVEDIEPEYEEPADADPDDRNTEGFTAFEGARVAEESHSGARERRDDLFRIRKTSRTLARHRADAISGAARRKPPVNRTPME